MSVYECVASPPGMKPCPLEYDHPLYQMKKLRLSKEEPSAPQQGKAWFFQEGLCWWPAPCWTVTLDLLHSGCLAGAFHSLGQEEAHKPSLWV